MEARRFPPMKGAPRAIIRQKGTIWVEAFAEAKAIDPQGISCLPCCHPAGDRCFVKEANEKTLINRKNGSRDEEGVFRFFMVSSAVVIEGA